MKRPKGHSQAITVQNSKNYVKFCFPLHRSLCVFDFPFNLRFWQKKGRGRVIRGKAGGASHGLSTPTFGHTFLIFSTYWKVFTPRLLILHKEEAYVGFFQYVLRIKKLEENALPWGTNDSSVAFVMNNHYAFELWGVNVLLHDDNKSSLCCIVFMVLWGHRDERFLRSCEKNIFRNFLARP